MPFTKAEAAKTIEVTEVTGAAPPIPWWLIGLGAIAIVIIIAAARKT
jgi:hypothetical protein